MILTPKQIKEFEELYEKVKSVMNISPEEFKNLIDNVTINISSPSKKEIDKFLEDIKRELNK